MSNFVKPLNAGMIYKIIKKDNVFIHTMIEGDLLFHLGFSPIDIIGKTLHDFFPEDYATIKQEYYIQAWEGKFIQYETRINGIYQVATLNPIIKDNKVVEVIGFCINIPELKRSSDQLNQPLIHITEEILYNTLQKITPRIQEPLKKKNLMINDYYHTIFVLINDIIFIERLNRKSIIHTKEKRFETYESLTSLFDHLNHNFLRCHKSYIINTDYLESINQSGQKYYCHFKQYDKTAKISKNLVMDIKIYMTS